MSVHGLRNIVRVYVLGTEPKYSKEYLNKIANEHSSPLPRAIRRTSDMHEWLAVYNAFLEIGLSSKTASEETDERKFWYD